MAGKRAGGNRRWRRYERVAVTLFERAARKLGMADVRPDTQIRGRRSGTSYNIEGIAVEPDRRAVHIIECRRKRRTLTQQELCELGYRRIDTRARGMFLITPGGLQRGGRRIATRERIR